MFCALVRENKLKGYKIFGLPPALLYDGNFDYKITKNAETKYDPSSNKLGINFANAEEIERQDLWLEYKISNDQLIDNFNSEVGTESHKYFEILDLLVCWNVDLAVRNFEIQEISEENQNLNQRTLHGATHLIIKENNDHVIQVICLEKVLETLSLL
jgi:hypothetical protein